MSKKMTDEGANTGIDESPEVEMTIEDTLNETLDRLENEGQELETEPKAAAEPVVGESQAEGLIKTPVEPEVTAERAAPNTWRKEVAAEYAKLPNSVKDEIEKREADFHKGIEQYKTKAQFGHEIEQTLAPYMATIQALNVPPATAIKVLLNADHQLRYGNPESKLQAMLTIARDYNIDVSGLVNVQPAVPPDPQFQALHQKVSQLEGTLQQRQQQEIAQANRSIQTEIEKFASDPVNKHFETVRLHMSSLISGGQATDLKDAYDQAVWANPTTRAAVLAEQQKVEREAADKKAKEAKRSGNYIRSRPALPTKPAVAGKMEDDIGAIFDDILSRG